MFYKGAARALPHALYFGHFDMYRLRVLAAVPSRHRPHSSHYVTVCSLQVLPDVPQGCCPPFASRTALHCDYFGMCRHPCPACSPTRTPFTCTQRSCNWGCATLMEPSRAPPPAAWPCYTRFARCASPGVLLKQPATCRAWVFPCTAAWPCCTPLHSQCPAHSSRGKWPPLACNLPVMLAHSPGVQHMHGE
eukprot:313247-Pelagomonas_calceolata.AAC.8